MWLEEAGFQDGGLKKKVVKPMRSSLHLREVTGEVKSPGGSLATTTEL
jgi:hypothetical protein